MIRSQKRKVMGKLLVAYSIALVLVGLTFTFMVIAAKQPEQVVEAVRADCPGDYIGNMPDQVEPGGFWGHYYCPNGVGTGEGCNINGVYTPYSPTSRPRFDTSKCGVQQIDYCIPYTKSDGTTGCSNGLQWETCRIRNCTTPPVTTPPVTTPPVTTPPVTTPPVTTPPVTTPPPSCPNVPTVSVRPNGGTFGRNPITIQSGQTFDAQVDSKGMNYIFTVYRADGKVGRVCTNPAGMLGVVGGACSGSETLNINDPWWGGAATVRVDGVINGERVPGCLSEVPVRIADVPTITPTPGYTIDKIIVDPDDSYRTGETVTFLVRIINTGGTTFDTVAFRDIFNPSRLQYLSGVGHRNGNADVAINFSVNQSAGTISHADLTTILGNLGPGENFDLRFRFRALGAVNRTCNDAFVTPDNMTEITDRACLTISQETPVTDR